MAFVGGRTFQSGIHTKTFIVGRLASQQTRAKPRAAHCDFGEELWLQGEAAIEKLQKDFLYRVPALRELNYWQQLEHLKMLLLQRCLERYRILYVWKVIEAKVPNCEIKVRVEEGRQGRVCEVPLPNSRAPQSVQTMRDQTFQVNGPQLFKLLPVKIRNLTKCSKEDFKRARLTGRGA